ncbi:MAG TPA: hypothetical protein VHA15_02190 [Burkholderiales bacterium]|jgi:hypothetical protein|nr:hypothetical protein [Burkholderiales bacterium]
MPEGSKKATGTVRPIRTRRDYKGAESVVKKISGQADRESAAEKRLQSLIREMERFDGDEDDDAASDGGYAGPRRRWSDESSDPE